MPNNIIMADAKGSANSIPFNFLEAIDSILIKAGFIRFNADITSGGGTETINHNLGVIPSECFAINEDIDYTADSRGYQAGIATGLVEGSVNTGFTIMSLTSSSTNTSFNGIIRSVIPEIQWNAPLPNSGVWAFVKSVDESEIVLRDEGGNPNSKMRAGKWRIYLR